MSDEQVKETTVYENFIGDKVELPKESNLVDFFDGEFVEEDQEKEWKKHWKDMPEFVQEENKPYKTIQIHFKTKEDYENFAKLIDQPLTDKTKSTWHPRLEITKNSLLRWIEDDD